MVQWRRTGILFLVLLILVGVAFFVTKHAPPVEPTPTSWPPVFHIPLSDVVAVDVYKGDAHVRLVHDEGGWRIEAPDAATADDDEVERRLRSFLLSVAFDRFTPTTLEEYGLASPQARIVLDTGEQQVTVRVGDVNPTNTDYYIQVQGEDTVAVVGKYAVDRILEWVDHPPLPPTPTPTVTITPQTGGE